MIFAPRPSRMAPLLAGLLAIACTVPPPPGEGLDHDASAGGGTGGETGGTGDGQGGNRPPPLAGGAAAGGTPGFPVGGMAAGGSAPSAGCPGDSFRERPLLRLTRQQYQQTLEDLLGSALGDEMQLPAPDQTTPLGGEALIPANALAVEGYRRTALAVAGSSAGAALIAGLPGCADPASDTCGRDIARRLGERVFRRVLTDVEERRWTELFGAIAPVVGTEPAGQRVLATMLQAPAFLYRLEIGRNPGKTPILLTDFEIATRMSYLAWGTAPDAELFEQARAGGLEQTEGRMAALERMLASPRSARQRTQFVLDWLRVGDVTTVGKDPSRFPGFGPTEARAMLVQAEQFITDTLAIGSGGLFALLNRPVAPGQTSATGILGLPWFATTHSGPRDSNPSSRGAYVLDNLLCSSVPAPPAGSGQELPPDDGAATTRERFEQSVVNPACAACHRLIDQIGFGFENFDAVGNFRINENGKPIDASGELFDGQTRHIFAGQAELAALLSRTPAVTRCLATKYVSWVSAQAPGPDADCLVATLASEVDIAMGNLDVLPRQLVSAAGFIGRNGTVPPPGPPPAIAPAPKNAREVERALLGFLVGEYAWVIRQVADSDRQSLEIHMDALRELERRLANGL